MREGARAYLQINAHSTHTVKSIANYLEEIRIFYFNFLIVVKIICFFIYFKTNIYNKIQNF
jgi:hypothetical protein